MKVGWNETGRLKNNSAIVPVDEAMMCRWLWIVVTLDSGVLDVLEPYFDGVSQLRSSCAQLYEVVGDAAIADHVIGLGASNNRSDRNSISTNSVTVIPVLLRSSYVSTSIQEDISLGHCHQSLEFQSIIGRIYAS